MRCYIKEYFYSAHAAYMGIQESFFDRIYQDEHWSFTGKIKYQRDAIGYMRVSFEVVRIDHEPASKIWHESKDFDFDESTAPVIIDCDTKYGI